MKFFEAFANVFRIPDLRNRVLFTLAMLAVYRLGGHIPTPGIDANRLEEYFKQNAGGIFGFFDLFSGGMFRRLTIFALGIMPYITSSIILQLLTVVVPTLEKLSKEGEVGRRKITQWTRYLTVVLALFQSFGIAMALQSAGSSGGGFVLNPGFGFIAMTMISLTTGTAFIMWLGEQITERGIGNGMSLIIFTGIVIGLPKAIEEVYNNVFITRQWNPFQLIVIVVMMIAVIGLIVLVERGERRIPVQYAKRVVGRRDDDRRDWLDCAGGARRTSHPGAVCQARRGPSCDGWTADSPAAEGQRRWRDPGDLRAELADLPANLFTSRMDQEQPMDVGVT